MDRRWKKPLIAATCVFISVVVVVVVWGIRQDKKAEWFSAWASGASAVVAVIALCIASVAAMATIETNRNQSEQLRRLEETNLREQASKMAAWIYFSGKNSLARSQEVRYHNAGPLPVYDVTLTFFAEGKRAIIQYPTLDPTNAPERLSRATRHMNDFVRGLGEVKFPGSSVSESGDTEINNYITDLFDENKVSVQMDFSDGEKTWRRLSNGKLILRGHIHVLGIATEVNEAKPVTAE
ncbi:hypothetical protein [Amycolatopsis sp. WAC 01376]|uniref:hypothetical protein n=1 Tax=Amycolatopsis sp. WAC 01376 TaxID=2203195 RepID=UPI000F7989AA|nr:hypothetical protein [Amycolatopsis sp. WAC 01376]